MLGEECTSNTATEAFAVYEGVRIVAGWLWQPPPFGAAKAVAPGAPHGVLALSRMVALPRDERSLRHISKPLRRQMRVLIDRSRWPVLVTWHDEGLGHNGHVYKCSGWQPDGSRSAPTWVDAEGHRASTYRNGSHDRTGLTRGPDTRISRWVHRVVSKGDELAHMHAAGWVRRPSGGFYRSGSPRMRVVPAAPGQQELYAGMVA